MSDGGFPGLRVEHRDEGLHAEVVLDAESRWFTGHFPHDPVLPAIAHLELVSRVHRAGGGSGLIHELDAMRLTAPARPGDRLELTLTPTASGAWRFDLRTEGGSLSEGLIRWGRETDA